MENNNTFVQMPLSMYLKLHPAFIKALPDELDLSDKNYVVRFRPGSPIVECGYLNDKWSIR